MNESNAVLTKHIGFRISPEAFDRIQDQADREGKAANVWCRERVIEASERKAITLGEKTILDEVLATQEIIVRLLYTIIWEDKPSMEKFRQITSSVHEAITKDAQRLLMEMHQPSQPVMSGLSGKS